MSYLTISQYQQKTGLALTGVNSVYLDYKLQNWSDQIDELTATSFRIPTLPSTKTVIAKSSNINFGAFHNAIISIKSSRSSSLQPLVENVGYAFKYPSFRTFIGDVEAVNPVIGIELYQTLLCSPLIIQIQGLEYWFSSLPNDLINVLYQLIDTTLNLDEKAYDSGMLPPQIMQKQLSGERDQTRSVNWNRDSKHLENQMSKLRAGVNHHDFGSVIHKYFRHSLNLTQSINL